jgi:hypothetical protein
MGPILRLFVEFLYKVSVVQWKDIRPWQPQIGPEEKHFVSGSFTGFSLYIINFIKKDQRSCDGWSGGHLFFRVPHSSFRVRHSSVGCIVTRKVAA